MSAHFSVSSVNAIVAVVIVESPSDRLVGRTSTISGTTMATPTGIAAAVRQAASGYALRALPHKRTYTISWDINAPTESVSGAGRQAASRALCPAPD